MAASKRTTDPAAGPDLPPLPKISLARFREVGYLVERLTAENTDVFIGAGQAYRARHRAGASRPLNHLEIAQLAAGLGVPLADAVAQAQEVELTGYDEPAPQEVLLAAGIGTAPQFIDAMSRVVALLELPEDEFDDACEHDRVDEALRPSIALLDKLELLDARQRAERAMRHLAERTGADTGKAWGLVAKSVWQGLQQAMSFLTAPATGPFASSIGSPPSAAGADEPSSMTPPGETSAT